jgi:hypothetical protein
MARKLAEYKEKLINFIQYQRKPITNRDILKLCDERYIPSTDSIAFDVDEACRFMDALCELIEEGIVIQEKELIKQGRFYKLNPAKFNKPIIDIFERT